MLLTIGCFSSFGQFCLYLCTFQMGKTHTLKYHAFLITAPMHTIILTMRTIILTMRTIILTMRTIILTMRTIILTMCTIILTMHTNHFNYAYKSF